MRAARGLIAVVISLLVLAGVAVLAKAAFDAVKPDFAPIPGAERCVATADENSVAVSPDQAHYAALISGLSVRRGLPARAASIALATAYQESNIDNIDYGDRDSVGLFQQRPSMGWGTKKQLLNPIYATNAFYDALIKVDDWQNGDITEIAQSIQISAFPEAYRDHEADARILASVLTGHSRAAIRCLIREPTEGRPKALTRSLRKIYAVKPTREQSVITVKATSARLAWSYAQFAVANAETFGVRQVRTAGHSLTIDDTRLPEWQQIESVGKRTVEITVN